MNKSVACILLCALSLHMPAFSSETEFDKARLNPRNWVKAAGELDMSRMNPRNWVASAGEGNANRLNPRNWGKSNPQKVNEDFEDAKGEIVGGKPGEEIKTFMLKQAQKFKSVKGAIVSTIRNGEVVKVSIPTSVLFVPNDTVLLSEAEMSLRPILTFMRRDLTTLIIAGHSDNTGSKAYTQRIAHARALAVENWFRHNGVTSGEMQAFSFGDEQPLFDNDSMENRAKNRRVTFYLVPNKEMVKQAKRKRLNK